MMDEPASAIVVTVPKWRIGGSFEGNTRTGVAMGLMLTIPAGTTPTAGALVAGHPYLPLRIERLVGSESGYGALGRLNGLI